MIMMTNLEYAEKIMKNPEEFQSKRLEMFNIQFKPKILQ